MGRYDTINFGSEKEKKKQKFRMIHSVKIRQRKRRLYFCNENNTIDHYDIKIQATSLKLSCGISYRK